MTITVIVETWGHIAEATITDTAEDGSQLVTTMMLDGTIPHRLTVYPGHSIAISEAGVAKDATEINPPAEPTP